MQTYVEKPHTPVESILTKQDDGNDSQLNIVSLTSQNLKVQEVKVESENQITFEKS